MNSEFSKSEPRFSLTVLPNTLHPISSRPPPSHLSCPHLLLSTCVLSMHTNTLSRPSPSSPLVPPHRPTLRCPAHPLPPSPLIPNLRLLHLFLTLHPSLPLLFAPPLPLPSPLPPLFPPILLNSGPSPFSTVPPYPPRIFPYYFLSPPQPTGLAGRSRGTGRDGSALAGP